MNRPRRIDTSSRPGIANPAGVHKSRPAELGGNRPGSRRKAASFFYSKASKPSAESYININAMRLFSEIRFMTAEDLDGIIAKARKGEHTAFCLIKNHRSYVKAKAY